MKATVQGKIRHLAGWKRDRPDHRDMVHAAWMTPNTTLPPSVDLTPICPSVRDQGELGSCTAHGTTEMMESLYKKAGMTDPAFSRLFVYWVSRVKIENTPADDDSGCQIRDVMKAITGWGACIESLWPYDIGKFSDTPSHDAFVGAKQNRITRYVRCTTLTSIKQSMAAGYTVVGGFSVPASMMSEECAQTGDVQYPGPDEEIVGGHCVLFTGYDDSRQRLKFQNSWGEGWGNNGSGTLPYSYVTSGMATDFWCLHGEMGVAT